MTASQLKAEVEDAGHDSHFFTPSTMKFFGDTMANYGVRETVITTTRGETVAAWELYRRRPVKHNLQSPAYFSKADFRRMRTYIVCYCSLLRGCTCKARFTRCAEAIAFANLLSDCGLSYAAWSEYTGE